VLVAQRSRGVLRQTFQAATKEAGVMPHAAAIPIGRDGRIHSKPGTYRWVIRRKAERHPQTAGAFCVRPKMLCCDVKRART
jgi:hypothetical protein